MNFKIAFLNWLSQYHLLAKESTFKVSEITVNTFLLIYKSDLLRHQNSGNLREIAFAYRM